MNYREAALQVLRDNRKPLHYEEIAKQAIERGYIEPKGKTPQDTISTEISRDLRKNGEHSEFIKYGKGLYGLRELEYVKTTFRQPQSVGSSVPHLL